VREENKELDDILAVKSSVDVELRDDGSVVLELDDILYRDYLVCM